MFFPPIGVKRVRLEKGQAYRMMTATWGGGANSPVAATGNLDDFGKSGAGTNSLIRNDTIRESTFSC
jgi:hypothetical protein